MKGKITAIIACVLSLFIYRHDLRMEKQNSGSEIASRQRTMTETPCFA